MTDPTNLDDLIGAWAREVRLPAPQVESIRQRIVAEPPPWTSSTPSGLDSGWWRDLAIQIAGVVVQANRPAVSVG